MPVYNGGKYLNAAIESILSQTEKDFEFIIINDGSKDNSAEIIKSYTDHRIVYVEQENHGLAATLNRGIDIAHGKYIARMDADDIALPARLEAQVAYLESHPRTAVIGTWAEIFTDTESGQRFHFHPTDNDEIKFFLMRNNPFVHSSVMFRRDACIEVGCYTTDPARQPPEDYELWSRMAKEYDMANIGQVLLRYREIPTSICRTVNFEDKVRMIAFENISAWMPKDTSEAEKADLVNVLGGINGKVTTPWRRMQRIILGMTMNIVKTTNSNDVRVRRLRQIIRKKYCRNQFIRYAIFYYLSMSTIGFIYGVKYRLTHLRNFRDVWNLIREVANYGLRPLKNMVKKLLKLLGWRKHDRSS